MASTNVVFGQKPMCLRKTKQNSSVYNCYPLIDKRKMKSGSAIFSLLNKEIKMLSRQREMEKLKLLEKKLLVDQKQLKEM